MSALSLVSARIEPSRQAEVAEAYRAMVETGLPPVIRETFLLAADDGTVAIATLWNSREALDEVRLGSEEPFARRVLREAGGEPEARFFDVVAGASADSR